MFERALLIIERTLGPDHPDVASSLNNLGAALRDLGQPEAARTLFKRALLIVERTLGPDHPDVASSLNNVGAALRDLGQPEAARTLFERALLIIERTFGPDHQNVATSLNNLAITLMLLGDATGARPLFERYVVLTTRKAGSDSALAAEAMYHLGEALAATRDYVAARTVLNNALSIMEQRLGSERQEVAAILGALAIVLTNLGEVELADEALERSIRITDTWAAENPLQNNPERVASRGTRVDTDSSDHGHGELLHEKDYRGPEDEDVHLLLLFAGRDRIINDIELGLSSLIDERVLTSVTRYDVSFRRPKDEADVRVQRASIVLILLNLDFVSSGYSRSSELREIVARRNAGNIVVIPVVLRHVSWLGQPFGTFPSLPRAGRPIANWNSQDEAIKSVVDGVRLATIELLEPRGTIMAASCSTRRQQE